jgi:hypothetical protein
MIMDQMKIKTLLQKYYDGTSTLDEEDALVEYFLDNEVPDEFAKDREQVLGFANVRDEAIPVPLDLDQQILKKLEPFQNETKVRSLPSRTLYTAISVAASILIIASALFFMNRQPDFGSYEDPELAYAETREALEMVSKYFAKGTGHMTNLSKMEDAMKPLNTLEKVETPRKSLNYLKSFDQGIKKTYGLIDLDKSKEE